MGQQFQGQTSKTLDAAAKQFLQVVWQNDRMPQDSEMNLMAQVADERLQQQIRSLMPSGWLQDPLAAHRDLGCSVENSNLFFLGQADRPLWANVNGWIVPVTGTLNAGHANTVHLAAPPTSDSRIDLVWLEVWLALVAPNPSTVAKPSASTIHKYGNTLYGGVNPADDLIHPEVGYESTRRVQVQYRLRVQGSGASGIDLSTYPEGMNDPNVLAQGTTGNPVAGQTFTNQRANGDQGLWRAGPGLVDQNSANPLGTLDGYVYAIPVAAIFRRNSDGWAAADAPNHNGAYSRGSVSQVLGALTLVDALDYTTSGVVQVSGLADSGFQNPDLYAGGKVVLAQVGQEVVSISATSAPGVVPETITITRARAGSMASSYAADTPLTFWTHRPDGLFADQVTLDDILDLRHSVRPAWDHDQLLQGALWNLLRGQTRSAYKQSYEGGGGQGTKYLEVSTLLADGSTAVSTGTSALDGPDGIRTVWSDAISVQRDVTIMLDPAVAKTGGYTSSTFDQGVSWQIGATTLKASGFVPSTGAGNNQWVDGTVIRLYLGGDTGVDGARATFRDGSTRQVRFVSPEEMWTSDQNPENQHPVTFRAIQQTAYETPATSITAIQTPGAAYPTSGMRFEGPILFLGGLAHADLRTNVHTSTLTTLLEIDLGINFATWSSLLVRGTRTLKSLLTNNGKDVTGQQSDLYIVLTGDSTAAGRYNNGAFRVIGAGDGSGPDGPYTVWSASNPTSLRLLALSPGYSGWDDTTNQTLTVELRTPYCNAEDGDTFASGIASSVVVLTDIQGRYDQFRNPSDNTWNPWNTTQLGALAIPAEIAGPAVLSVSLLYGPSRGGTLRVQDAIHNLTVTGAAGLYLRRPLTTLDTSLNTDVGYPTSDIVYPPALLQTSNAIPLKGNLLGLDSDGRVGTEVLRDAELMVDPGSKSLWFRPLQRKDMTLRCHTGLGDLWVTGLYPLPNNDPMDAAGIFTSNRTLGCALPQEIMPRFGRLDIPYYRDAEAVKGTGNFLDGLNHLFCDNLTASSPVFNLVGGTDNGTAGEQVTTMLFQTGAASGLAYGRYGTLIIGSHDAWQARLVNDPYVQSSDMGKGLVGIELPTGIGIARLLGVYERSNYIAKSGSTFEADRVNVTLDPATNLLRTDQDKMTLFIRRNGASDVMRNASGWHTYVVPQHMLDLTRISTSNPANPGYNPALGFDSYQYVVEAEIFGFAHNWINENNWLLVRRHNGAGAAIADNVARTLSGVPMSVPAAAPINEEVLVTGSRVPYQGDPYGSHNGALKDMRDEPGRYGAIPVASARALATPLDQFDSGGNMQIETPNARAFEVLASTDFVTSLGTGKVGGRVFPDSVTDAGWLDTSSRIPSASNADPVRTVPRTFNASQQGLGDHATAVLEVNSTNNTLSAPVQITISGFGKSVTLTAKDPTNYTGAPLTFLTYPPVQVYSAQVEVDLGNIVGGSEITTTLPVAGVIPTSSTSRSVVVVTPASLIPGLVFDGYVNTANTVTIRATNITANPINPAMMRYNVEVITNRPNDGAIGTSQTAAAIASAFNASLDVQGLCRTVQHFGNKVVFTASEPGDLGNSLSLSVSVVGVGQFRLVAPKTRNTFWAENYPTSIAFSGGRDAKVSSGTGLSSVSLTGCTNQLPLGILCQDADFQAESTPAQLRVQPAIQVDNPTVYLDGEVEYETATGMPGDVIAMADAANLQYNATGPGAVRKFRTYRGATAWNLSGHAGGPMTWGLGLLNRTQEPLVKSGVIVGRALLVRNAPEDAFSSVTRVSEGSEIQMVVLTQGHVGHHEADQDLLLNGKIGPCGHGEGYASAERYRIAGRPLVVPKNLPDPNVPLAPWDPRGEQ